MARAEHYGHVAYDDRRLAGSVLSGKACFPFWEEKELYLYGVSNNELVGKAGKESEVRPTTE